MKHFVADDITIIIPTYGREGVLIETIQYLLALKQRAGAVVVMDQTPEHEQHTNNALREWSGQGLVHWVHLRDPSIPGAMNAGMLEANTDYVLFLDDDIIPHENLVAAHVAALNDLIEADVWCIVGQVLQQGEDEISLEEWTHKWFPFNNNKRQFVSNAIGCNLCVNREKALEIGGFDENFVGVAYRFETEFCRRIIRAGGKVLFEPTASIRHLRAEHGGTRSRGSHLTSASPAHGVGDYYFALRQGLSLQTLAYIIRRPFREVRTKFHLRHPWWIPVKLTGEIRALIQALYLNAKGPRYVQKVKRET